MADLQPSAEALALISNAGKPDYNALLTMQRIQQAQQVNQAQNALKALYSDQSNYDPKTMQPTSDAWGKLMQVSPAAGMDLRNNLLALQQKQAQATFTQGKVAKEYQDQAADNAAKSLAGYNEYVKDMPPDDARQRVQTEIYGPMVSEMKQGMPPELAAHVAPDFQPARANATVMNAKLYEAQQKKAQEFENKTDYGRTPPVEYRVYGDGRMTSITGKAPYVPSGIGESKGAEATLWRGKTADGKEVRFTRTAGGAVDENNKPIDASQLKDVVKVGTERQQTPAARAFDKFMEEHPDATSAEQTKFIESQHPARSGPAAAVRKFMEENPNASAADIASFNAWQRETGAAAQAFATGTQGNLVRAQNVAIDHMGFLGGDLIPALKNGDIRAVNRLENWAKTEFGHSGPVDFNFAKGIVSQEVNKAIVNVGAGTEEERKNLSGALDAANSPEQLAKVLSAAKRLMAGQLRGLEQQYIDAATPPEQRGDPKAIERSRASFRQKLFPHTLEELGVSGGGAGSAPAPANTAPAGAPAASAPLPPAGQQEAAQPAASAAVPPMAALAPQTSAAVGDSIAAGVGEAGKLPGKFSHNEGDRDNPAYSAVWGRTTRQVLNAIRNQDADAYKGKTVYLSSGASNSPTQLDDVASQLEILQADGANVVLAGVGSGVRDYKNVNKRLAEIADKAGVPFTGRVVAYIPKATKMRSSRRGRWQPPRGCRHRRARH